MTKKHEQAQALLEGLEQVDEGMLQQAYATDTPERFHALGKIKQIKAKQERPVSALRRWGAVAACLAVILALAASPWFFSSLLPVIMPTEPIQPPTTTQPLDTEPVNPTSPLTILSGGSELTDPVEYLNRTETFVDSTGQWDSIMGWDAYWAVHDVFTQNITLPVITLGEDIQLIIENNGQLKAISAYGPDYYGDPRLEMTSIYEENLFSLTGGQWYIVVEIMWQGRYIESKEAYEVFVYNYLFLLDVPDVKDQPFDWNYDEATHTLTVSGCEEIPTYGSVYSDELPPWQDVKQQIQHIVISDGVKQIGAHAFSEMESLLSVTLPDGLEEIGEYAFFNDPQLTKINLPEQLQVIGKSAFEQCQSLTSITIGANIQSISHWAFAHCTALQEVTILGSVKVLSSPFDGCDELKIIRFCGDAPDYLGSITGDELIICYYPASNPTWTDAILDTANLYYTVWFASEDPASEKLPGDATTGQCGRTAYWELKDGVMTISGSGEITYIGWENHRDDIKNVIIEDGITGIVSAAFYQCGNLTSVTVPQSVTSIGFRAFYECYKLKAVTLPANLEYMGDYAFWHCESLEKIVFPESITVIPRGAFLGCKSLTSITFPSGLTEVDEIAFQNCTSIKELHFPATVTVLRDGSFSGCTSLKKIYFYGDAPGTGNFTFEDVTATAYYPPGNVSWISGGMGHNGGMITEKPDPNQENQGCITHDFSEWVITAEPNPLEWGSKERYCVACGYKETEGLPPIVYECEPTEHPELGEPIASGKDHNVQWKLYADGTLSVYGVRWMEGTNKTHKWKEYAEQITRVIVEEGLSIIPNRAFSDLPNLTSVELPWTLWELGNEVFANCPKLTTVTLPVNTAKLGAYLFSRCSMLETVIFLGSAPEMDRYAFKNLTTTAYYPTNDPTWTEETLKNYGGTISWIAADTSTENTDSANTAYTPACAWVLNSPTNYPIHSGIGISSSS